MDDQPPPMPNSSDGPPQKKGLHPLAWAGIGCGGLLVVAVLLIAVGSAWFFNRAAGFLQEIEENPTRAAAKMYVNLNPELEMISADDEGGTLTFRVVETGEEVTFTYDDIANETFSYETTDGTTTFSIADDGSGVSIESPDGSAEFGSVDLNPEELPPWVRPMLYPAIAEVQSVVLSREGASSGGTLIFSTSDAVDDVAGFYKRAIEDAGMTVQDSVSPDLQVMSISGEQNGRNLSVQCSRIPGGTQVLFIFAEP